MFITRKGMEKRLDEHLGNTHGFLMNPVYGAMTLSGTVDAENFERTQENVRYLRNVVSLLLSHLGLEIQVTDAKPSETILVPVKKAKA